MPRWPMVSGTPLAGRARATASMEMLALAGMPSSSMAAGEVGAAVDGMAVGAGAEAGDIPATGLASAAGAADGDLVSAGASAGTRIGRFIPIPIGTACGGATPMDISRRPATSTHIRINLTR